MGSPDLSFPGCASARASASTSTTTRPRSFVDEPLTLESTKRLAICTKASALLICSPFFSWWRNMSADFSSAANITAPSSAGSRARRTREPSVSVYQRTRRLNSCSSRSVSWRRKARIARSSCDAVQVFVSLSSVTSSTRSAALVASRTFEYDSSPAVKAALISGSCRRHRATRTCSRAVPGDSEHAQDSQWAQCRIPPPDHPPDASNSATRLSQVAVAAASCPAAAHIRAHHASAAVWSKVGTRRSSTGFGHSVHGAINGGRVSLLPSMSRPSSMFVPASSYRPVRH